MSTRATDEKNKKRFLRDLAGALHSHGTPSDRLEALLVSIGEELGLKCEFFATPTAIFAAFGPLGNQQMALIAPPQWDIDLGRLAALDEVAQEVASGSRKPRDGSAEIRRIMSSIPHPTWVRLPSHAVFAGAVALLMSGGPHEAIVASFAGLLIGLLEVGAAKSEALGRLVLPIGAFLAAALGALGTLVWPDLSPAVVGIAGIIYLVPGLTTTVAMKELATGHLVSGTARLAKAFLTFMLLGFGALLGASIAQFLPAVSGPAPVELGRIWFFLAVLASLIPTVLLLNVRKRDVPPVFVAMLIVSLAAELGMRLGGTVMAAGVATLTLGLLGNAVARYRNRPAAVITTPSVLLLVPGSVGFRAVSAFLADDVLIAVSLAFEVALTAAALVAGLLVANLALPPKKAL